MRNLFTRTLLSVLLLTAFLSPFTGHTQVMVYSTTGYQVSISVVPVTILPSTTNCPWGYNYNLGLSYNIVFSGINIPANLYTLQGTVGCTGGVSHFFDLPNNGGMGYTTTVSNQWRGQSDCASASVNSLRCNTVRVQIQGPGIPNQQLVVPVLAVLPVKLTEFTATADNNGVALRWTTATETANRSFTVERSADGETWQDLQVISGGGTSSTPLSYNYTDIQPLEGNNYYRLRQTSEDNSTTYSDSRLVNIGGAGRVVAYPMPLTGDVCYLRGLTDPQQYIYTVISTTGSAVRQGSLSGNAVNINGLAKGIYVLQLQHRRTGENLRLTIVRQ